MPFSTRKLLYHAMISPFLNFGAEIWGPSNIASISKVQKSIIRHVVKTKNFIKHTNPYFVSLNTLKFKDIITYQQIRLCHKIVHDAQPPGLFEIFRLCNNPRRQMDFITPAQTHFNCHDLKMPTILAPKVWNKLPTDTKMATSTKAMKSRFMKTILNSYTNPEIKKKCQNN